MDSTSTILAHTGKAYLLVHPDGSIDQVNPTVYTKILGALPRGTCTLEDYLPLPKKKGGMLQATIEQFFEDIMPMELTLELLPNRLHVSGRIIGLTYYPVIQHDSTGPEQLIVEMKDITQKETHKKLAEIAAQKNALLLRILQEKEGFLAFLSDSEKDINNLAQGCDLVVGKRILHTLKGNSAAFGMEAIASAIHDIEDDAEDRIKAEGEEAFFAGAAVEVSTLIDSFLIDHFSILRINRSDTVTTLFQISEQELIEIERQLDFISSTSDKNKILLKLNSIRSQEANIFLSTFPSTIERLAQSLDKKIRFEIEGGHIKVGSQSVGAVLRELIHVIRNCCDHGIETPEERREQGKPEEGSIIVCIREKKNNTIEISVEDDGRGIDIEKLTHAAIRNKVISEEEVQKMNSKEKLELLFLDGVSTAGKVSQVSGRGVGMAALKYQIDDASGTIEISTEIGKGSRFAMTMPQFPIRTKETSNMQVIKWDPSLSLGIERMDEQHQVLIGYLAELQELQANFIQKKPVEKEQVEQILTKLVDYTKMHFKEEEKLQEEKGFSELDQHRALHHKLLEQLGYLLSNFKEEGLEMLPRLTSFVNDWLKGHILRSDRKYADFIHGQGIEWTDSLKIGIQEMDEQHQQLLGYVNDFRAFANKAKKGELRDLKEVRLTLNRLIEYTVQHFKEEEDLLASYQYPDLAQHKLLHKRLVGQVEKFNLRFEEDPISMIPELSSFLSRWLIQHIKGHDKEYGDYINHQRAELPARRKA